MFFKKDDNDKLLEDLKELLKENDKFADLLKGVKRSMEKNVEEVMRPRTEVIMVLEDDSLDDLVQKFVQHRYSKYPVLSERENKIVGIAHIKDVFFHLDKDLKDVLVKEIKKEALFIPATQNCIMALKDLQRRRTSMGIVVDEYGSEIGIVTIEDILEEIVGDIYEEHDRYEVHIVQIAKDPPTYEVSAWLPLSELEERLSVDFGETESTSVGGFMIEKLGRMPEKGERITVENLEIVATEVSPQRVQKVLIRKLPVS
ncbi:MAG: HlyC/CorC family transporter [Thermotogae bacterium]|nr:HlyC/CorC family transporter [Thermotogota bacterium]